MEFAVVIPLFNKEAYISRAIISVLSQTASTFELVIVDDGSTDKSAEIAESFLSDPRVRVVKQPNKGVGEARNTGIRAAKSEWIAFLDADDMWCSDHLDELSRVIRQFPDIGMVSTACVKTTRDRCAVRQTQNRTLKRKKVDYFSRAADDIGFLNSSSVAVRRRAFWGVGLFANVPSGEDLEMWARLSLKYSCAVSSKPTSIYFLGTGGVMDTMSASRSIEPRLPQSLADISPSVATLVKNLEANSVDYSHRDQVIRYINSRFDAALRSAFIQRDVALMKRFEGLRSSDVKLPLTRWGLLARAPASCLRGLASMRSVVKRVYEMRAISSW